MYSNDKFKKEKTEMKKKVVFLSFANSVYVPSLRRLEQQIKGCPLVDEFHFLTNKDLDKEFKKHFNPYIYRRGYGYWKWKSYLVKQQFDKMEEGDILIYADAGCDYNADGEGRLNDYISIVTTNESGILVFEDRFRECQYTKGDVFKFLVADKKAIKPISETNQIWAGSFIIRKCDNTIDLVNRWVDVCMNHFDLITDKASIALNSSDFIENRHDQSVFSVLAKLHNAYALSASELHKANFKNVPFLPTRHKEKSIWTDIRRKLLLPYRYLLGLYLVNFKGFYFKDRFAW